MLDPSSEVSVSARGAIVASFSLSSLAAKPQITLRRSTDRKRAYHRFYGADRAPRAWESHAATGV
jgi:hypothetical protein